MNAYTVDFAPHLPIWIIALLAAITLLLIGWAAFKRARGTGFRALFSVLLLVALLNPVLHEEERDPQDDITVIVKDVSPSQGLADREAVTDEALADLRNRLEAMPGMRVFETEAGGDEDGTQLFKAIDDALAELDRSRIAAVIALSDGQVHDVPQSLEEAALGAPLHLLLTGEEGEIDRRLIIHQAPTFAMIGETQELVFEVSDLAADSPSGEPSMVTLRQDGQTIDRVVAVPGERSAITVELEKAGETVFELEVDALEGELTTLNNRAIVTVNGVRDRLRVLLVSGQPYPGLRVWRNLLKADPAVDLVHFTILRPPEKQDGTPIRELALIAFPSRELFEVKLGEFDLVIFDRYSRRGLLPMPYLDNVARYVEEGGALLEAAGPEFASPMSLYRTPLARVLPGGPSGEIIERPFKPAVSDLGRRHPVTADLAPVSGEPEWGRWFRQIDVEAVDAQVLMTGVADRPLLVLKRVGDGRVAQLLSDHHWLWQRGFEGGGPQAALLRRLVHWLMKEPELEEETLVTEPIEDGFIIERRSLEAGMVTLEIVAPDGSSEIREIEIGEDGIARTAVETETDGLWRIGDGERTTYTSPRPIAAVEMADMRASPEPMRALIEASGGAAVWLSGQGLPDLRRVEPDRRTAGRGWIGLTENGGYIVRGASETPLLPAWLAVLLLVGTALVAWWREGHS